MVFSKSRRRAIAPIVLGLWIFALAASIAHACGVMDSMKHVELPASAAVADGHAGDPAVPVCDQFCADDLPLLTKLKALEDGPASHTALGNACGPIVPSAVATKAEPPARGPDPPPALAINTRFVRLAL